MSRDRGKSGTSESKVVNASSDYLTPTKKEGKATHYDSTPMVGRNQRRIYSGHEGKEYSHYIADGLLRSAIFSMILGVDRNAAIDFLQTKLKKLFKSSFESGFKSIIDKVELCNHIYNMLLRIINLPKEACRNLHTELNFIGEAHNYFASIDRAARVAPFRGFLQEININFLQAINYKSLSFQGNYFFNPHSPEDFIKFYSNRFDGKEKYAFGNINLLNLLFNGMKLTNEEHSRYRANLLETIALPTDSNIFSGVVIAVNKIKESLSSLELTVKQNNYVLSIGNIRSFALGNLTKAGNKISINDTLFNALKTNLSNSIAYLLWIPYCSVDKKFIFTQDIKETDQGHTSLYGNPDILLQYLNFYKNLLSSVIGKAAGNMHSNDDENSLFDLAMKDAVKKLLRPIYMDSSNKSRGKGGSGWILCKKLLSVINDEGRSSSPSPVAPIAAEDKETDASIQELNNFLAHLRQQEKFAALKSSYEHFSQDASGTEKINLINTELETIDLASLAKNPLIKFNQAVDRGISRSPRASALTTEYFKNYTLVECNDHLSRNQKLKNEFEAFLDHAANAVLKKLTEISQNYEAGHSNQNSNFDTEQELGEMSAEEKAATISSDLKELVELNLQQQKEKLASLKKQQEELEQSIKEQEALASQVKTREQSSGQYLPAASSPLKRNASQAELDNVAAGPSASASSPSSPKKLKTEGKTGKFN